MKFISKKLHPSVLPDDELSVVTVGIPKVLVYLFIFSCGLIVMNIKSELTSVSRYQRAAHSKRKKYCSLQTVIDVRSLK